MDDFSTGFASLSGLQSFPFDKLKIDKTFVSGVEANPKSAEIVRAVIGLGRALKISSSPKAWRRKVSVPF